MRRRITVTALLTLVPVLGGAASTRLSELPLSAILVGDTILKSDLSVFRTSFLAGLIAAQKGPHLRLGLQEKCVPFLDLIRRSVNMSLDTNIRGFEFGVQISYDDRHSFVGQRTGSTQLRVMLFGQLQFSAGAIPFR